MKSNKVNLMFGTDPEFFLVEPGTTNLIPPVYLRRNHGLEIVNTDDPKHPVFMESPEFTIMEDGALFEFTVEPDTNALRLYGKVQTALHFLEVLGNRYNLKVLHSPIADFDVKRFFENEELDEEQRMCVIAGCDPDEDAIDPEYQSGVVRNLTTWNKRGAGGHLHISTTDIPDLFRLVIPTVHLLATTVGVASVLSSDNPDSERQRMEVFGRPGRYRTQQYPGGYLGVEYRTPSNSWLKHLSGVTLILNSATYAMNLLVYPDEGKKHIKKYLKDAIDIILNVNQVDAKLMLEDMGII